MTSDTVSLPDDFTFLPIPLPPMLASLIGHNGISRWFSLCYFGTKATWSSGWLSGTFSFYAAYQPLIEHPVLLPLLACRNLGSDDAPPDDALLCDRQEEKLYVGPYTQVERFLQSANLAPPSPFAEEVNMMPQHGATMGVEELRAQGMFEFLLGPTPAQQQLGLELIAWLDQFITEDLLATFRTAAGAGNPYARYWLRELEQRAARHKQV